MDLVHRLEALAPDFLGGLGVDQRTVEVERLRHGKSRRRRAGVSLRVEFFRIFRVIGGFKLELK
ncbi:hypothetical protein QCE63_18825 [Caballeronia sp. LZ065]|uniref:hypothetical protein n=1 Tax=Caballeronia sp. LZ065 TaxID=3038571 RepID=UPI0028604A92|nr:hypothetical protein [Caballeronia sp. LZ065]MDR5781456.1 hypothetical protein [Caballeronia sp. LZ065]